MKQPKVSVIIPVYNTGKYLKRCIDSILNQTLDSLEIILINDGSTDNSKQIMEEYKKIDERIITIHQDNQGPSAARNRGLEIAKGMFIGFIDSDDFIHKDMYNYLFNLATQKEIDIVSCQMKNLYKNSKLEVKDLGQDILTEVQGSQSFGEMVKGNITNLTVTGKLFRQSLIGNQKFRSDIPIAEDAEWLSRVVEETSHMIISNHILYYYYIRGNSITTSSFNEIDILSLSIYKDLKNFVIKKFPNLNETMQAKLCWAYFIVLDKLLLSEKIDNDFKKELILFLKDNKNLIIKTDLLTWNRKIAFIVLLVSEKMYKRVLKLKSEKMTKINN
ncbi:glycosyltransferase [Atopobacter phocae]|uniref:glycosyltransferase n=1 Tax=Atopobacter phocae TaxID=136492 RepID=UPI00046EA558|nr:glycosyltransferase [Atopobacter phocae]